MKIPDAITNDADIIDSRDIITRIDYLEDVLVDEDEDNTDFDHDELQALLSLASECEGYCDWKDGVTLIRYTHFETYAQEFANDVGMIKNDDKWPYTCIDWDKAAGELAMDYTTADFDGIDYLFR